MKSTHHKLRALGKGLVLAVCVVTGTAAMMTALSSAPASAFPDGKFVSSATAAVAGSGQQAGADSVLYQRVVQADGSQRWVLLEESQALAFAPASRDILMADADTPRLTRVSYTLQAKPAGWNRVLKNCALAETGKPQGSAVAYDIACAKLG